MTLRSGKSKCSPWYSQPSSQNIGMRHRMASSHTDRLSAEAPIERVQLRDAAALADAQLDAPVAQEVEGADPLGDARRVVGRQLHDAVTEADARRPLAGSGEEHLRRRRVAVLLEEVVLDLPGVVVAQPVGQLDLVESVVEQAVLVVALPRLRQLQLVEHAESHRPNLTLRCRRTGVGCSVAAATRQLSMAASIAAESMKKSAAST